MSDTELERNPSSISVIIPVYNDPGGIRDTLQCLRDQTYPSEDLEILPVDNGSTDATPAVISQIATTAEISIRPLSQTAIQSSYATRNKGIKNARGEYLLFLDADVTAGDTLLTDVVAAMEANNARYAGLNIETILPSEETRTAAANYDLTFGFPIKEYIQQEHFTVTGALVVRRDVFDQVGHFDERLVSSGDREFGNRVFAAGIEQHFFSDIVVSHPARTSLQSLFKKHIRIGRGEAQMNRYHPRFVDIQQLTNPLLYVPYEYPWKLRRWEANTLPADNHKRDYQELMKLYLLQYILDILHIFGRVKERANIR